MWRAERRLRAARHEPYGLRFSARHPLKLRAPNRAAARKAHAFNHPLTRLAAKAAIHPLHRGERGGIRCAATASPLPLWERVSAAILRERSSCASRMAGRVRGDYRRSQLEALLPWLRLRIMFRGRVKPAPWQVIDASDARRDGTWCWHGLPGRDLPRAHFQVRTPP
jgi:hypothetical protein